MPQAPRGWGLLEWQNCMSRTKNVLSECPSHPPSGEPCPLGSFPPAPSWARNPCILFARKDEHVRPRLERDPFPQERRRRVETARPRTPGASRRSPCRGRCPPPCSGSSRRWGSSVQRCVPAPRRRGCALSMGACASPRRPSPKTAVQRRAVFLGSQTYCDYVLISIFP